MKTTRLDRFAHWMGSAVPDAITASVILLFLLAGLAVLTGVPPAVVMDGYYRGLWMLLPFTMQMTLIIVLGTALSAAPLVRAGIAAMSRVPSSRNGVIVGAVLVSAVISYLHWGLGYALVPLVAVFFSKEAEKKGVAIDFPFLMAVTYAACSAWQFGFSASAPLLVATPGHFLESSIGIIPLRATIWAPATIAHEIIFTLALMVLGCRLMPRGGSPISEFPDSGKLAEAGPDTDAPPKTYSEKLERRRFVALLLCVVLAAWLYQHFFVNRRSLDINSLNTVLLLLTLLLHSNFKSFTGAVERAVTSSWPVIILYHLYAGVAGLIQFTPMGERMAALAATVSTQYTFPALTAIAGTVVSVFVPSSGGQWAIQGFVTSKAALAAGVSVQRGLLALSVGDQMGNLTTPFWYVVIAGIARLDFRRFFGYGLIFAALWFAIGVIAFTFLPC